MKLCNRLFVLYCRSRPIDDKSTHFDPHFEEVRGGVEPWLMACWKACVEFFLSVGGLLFLSLTVEALQGKMCQNSLPSGVGRSLGAKISGGRGRPWRIFFGFYKTRHILLFNSANCTVLRAVVLTQYRCVTDRRTDGQTDGIAIASTALAIIIIIIIRTFVTRAVSANILNLRRALRPRIAARCNKISAMGPMVPVYFSMTRKKLHLNT